jgi:SAM-dependent methyltransferase
MSGEMHIFRCPACRASLDESGMGSGFACGACGAAVQVFEGVPALVRDADAVARQIREAKASGRAMWYEESQLTQWEGPYRHHVLKRKKYVESVLARHLAGRSGAAVGLDMGCGDGANFFWLAQHVGVLYGSDYNIERLARAAKRPGPRMVFMADCTDYPANDDSFDAVYFNHVLEHIPDDAAVLCEVRRILKPGGVCVLGVPNEGAWFWRLAYKLQPELLRTSDHVHFYTAETIAEKCRAAGFQINEIKHIGWGVPHWALDSKIRGVKVVDDALELFGRTLLKSQATSLYLILTRA